MSTRGAILLAIGMLLLGLVIGGLTGGVAGFFMGQGSRPVVSRVVPTSVPPVAQQLQPTQPTQPQPRQQPTPSNPNPRGGFPPALNVLGGARVDNVEKDSPAAKAGLQTGDIITAVGSTRLDANHSLGDLVQAHKPGEKVDLSVTRGAQTLTLTAELGASPQDGSKAWLGISFSPIPGGRFRVPGN